MKLLEQLRCAMRDGKSVSVFGDASDYNYKITGHIQSVDESGLLLSKQDVNGYNDGFVLFTDIVYFETDTADTKRHDRLYQLRGIYPDTLEIPETENIFEEVLKVCFEKQLACDIFRKEDDECDVIGFISELNDDYIVVYCIDKFGDYYGNVYMAKDDIFRIFIDGKYEKTFMFLYENK